jgi:hypothetical protein
VESTTGGSRCRRSRHFLYVTETTAGHDSTPVGGFKKRSEAQRSTMRKSSPDTAVRCRSCAEGSRDQLFEATGTRKLPTLKLRDGRIISHSRTILAWVDEQPEQEHAMNQVA